MRTAHLEMDLVAQSQAQKEVTINEAFVTIDALLGGGVIDRDISTPPASPIEGDAYIVGAAATDAWVGHEGDIAYYSNGWRFVSPNEGVTLWVNDEDSLAVFDGSAWQSVAGSSLNGLAELGVGTDADAVNKLAVRSDAVLFTAQSDDIRAVINKNSTNDTASYLFQTSFSGRAEFGLIGDDNFSLKVSSDGSVFSDALVVNSSTAEVDISQALTLLAVSTAPSAESGKAKIYLDANDQQVKIRKPDGSISQL